MVPGVGLGKRRCRARSSPRTASARPRAGRGGRPADRRAARRAPRRSRGTRRRAASAPRPPHRSPQHDGAQLPEPVERQSVVDAEDHVVRQVVEAVATLAVGVVHEHVERRELTEPVLVVGQQGEVVLRGWWSSTKRCSAPSPAGPSGRSTVTGTTPQPSACGTPRTPLPRAKASRPGSPRAAARPHGLVDRRHLDARGAGRDEVARGLTSTAGGRPPRGRRGSGPRRPRRRSVPAGAPVAGRVHRLVAQRARRAAGGDDRRAPCGQGPHLRPGPCRPGRRSCPRRPHPRRVAPRPRRPPRRRSARGSSMRTSSRQGRSRAR